MIEVLCNGNVINGFSSVSVSRSLDNIAASYSMSVFKDKEGSAWIPVFPGDEVEISIDGDTAIKGFNISTNPSFSARGTGCNIVGMEKTCDLIDCVSDTINFENKKVDEIVRIVCAQFGLKFSNGGVDVGSPLTKFSAELGATALNVIVNACKERNVYPCSDGLGNVTLIGKDHDAAEADLVQGENVLSAAGRFSVADRFSKYTVYSCKDASGKVFASVDDDEMGRTRTFVCLDERYATKENCEARALWEAKHRAANGNVLNVVVDGWKQKKGGSLWKPGLKVNCDIPCILWDSRSFLVNRVTFNYGSNGTTTSLELVDEDIYLPLPKIAPKTKLKKQSKDTWASVRRQTGSKLR